MSITRKQHYVWREYLRAWSVEDKIWSYLKLKNKVINVNLMGVAQERDFYEVSELTTLEKEFLIELVDTEPDESIKKLNKSILLTFISAGELKTFFENQKNALDLVTKIREIEKNTFENLHTIFEGYGKKIIKVKGIHDLLNLSPQDLEEALIFIMIQYTRTKKMKSSLLKNWNMGIKASTAMKAWSFISLFSAITIAFRVMNRDDLRVYLLINHTNISFVTSDQPIINIVGDKLNENNEIEELKLYYPISPQNALLIEFDKGEKSKFNSEEIYSIEKINFYNSIIAKYAETFVFCDNASILNGYLNPAPH